MSMEQGFNESDEAFNLRRIADALEDLLALYRGHIRLTARTALRSLEMLPDEERMGVIKVTLEELIDLADD